ncbi:MAG: amidohydrolase family protein, partial [Pyrinomonadaceae bacterium]|nr:amidohydrolase family protein [Phycisphaerales bacterium]
MARVLKIDLHTHILPERWPDWTQRSGYPGWIELDHHKPCCARMVKSEENGGKTYFREIGANCWDPAERLRECDERMGVLSAQVISTVPVMFSYWARAQDALDLAKLLNDHLAGVCDAAPVVEVRAGLKPAPPGPAKERSRLRRFMGLGTVPMQAPDLAIRELERCVMPLAKGGLGLAGIQIGTNVNGNNLDDPGVFEVLEAAASLGACVFVHPWDMLGKERMP